MPVTGMSIGELSRSSGVHVETIRYYERIGIIGRPDRTSGGHRTYDRAALKGLNLIRQCRDLGFGISDIRTLLGLIAGGYSCGEVRLLAEAQLDSVRRKLAELKSVEAALMGMIGQCGDAASRDCAIVDALHVEDRASGG